MMHLQKKKSKIIGYAVMISLFFLISATGFGVSFAGEVAGRVFEGREVSSAILANLDYTDVNSSNTWAKDAIWETGALELMKGYGEKRFGLGDRLTIEQALQIAYNMAGREAEAQLAAEALDLLRQDEERKTMAPRMWSDGYLQLALNDGLITQEQYDDAFQQDQLGLGPRAFRRNSSVTREDMAFFIAGVLEINPVNEQTHLFNEYRDWMDANPHRIPYIEALLQNKVMNGDNNGYFSPRGVVTREQASQIIQNAEPFIFQKHDMKKMKGTIESISQYSDKTDGNDITVTSADIRNSDGSLHQFLFTKTNIEGNRNEMAGNKNEASLKGVIVNDRGALKDETALVKGQEIYYIVRNAEVLYVSVIVNEKKVEYKLGRVLSVDDQNRVVRSEMLLNVPFSDSRLVDRNHLFANIGFSGIDEAFTVSENALIHIDFAEKTLRDLQPESLVLFTLENGLITVMEKVDMNLLLEEGIVSGILEENNPVLGYVTLFFPDGSGTSPDYSRHLSTYRTYSYMHPDHVTVIKNGRNVSIEDISPGDSVFLKLNEKGQLIQISGIDNFYPVYGRVRNKGFDNLLLEKQDGTFEQIPIPPNTPVFQERKRVTWNEINEGDNLRILLQKSGDQVTIGEVSLEKNKPETSGVYKATLAYFDTMSRNLVVSGLQQFKDGIWRSAQTSGMSKLQLNTQYMPDIQKGARGTVYLATGKNLMGNETVVRMVVEDQYLQSEIISDTIIEALPGLGSLTLLNRDTSVTYNDSTIIVKGGKLLEPNQVKSQDNAYLVVHDRIDGSKNANILWMQEPVTDTGLTLIRGRISSIDALTEMTLESFSQFTVPEWEFMNVPKTLTIDPAVTRIFDDSGRINLREFDDTGEGSYKDRTVYVLAQDGRAMLVSTAPYGDIVYKGRISRLEGMEKDAFGHVITPPLSILIKEATGYNPENWLWENEPDLSMSIPPNAVLMKNGRIIEAHQLEEGDRITVIQSVNGNDAYVVIAESY